MARTQAPDYALRREHIVAQAARLFAERGFLGASVADLADACGCSKSAIYHYYPSKEDILFDVMHSHVEALAAAGRAVSAEAGEPAETLRRFARALMELYIGAAHRHTVLINELEHLPPARRSAVVALERELIDLVERLLCAIEPRLSRQPTKRRPAVMLFFGMLNWTHVWYHAEGRLRPQAFADMAVDMVLGGLSRAI